LRREQPRAADKATEVLRIISDYERGRQSGLRSDRLEVKVGSTMLGVGRHRDPFRMVVVERDGGLDLMRVMPVTDHDAYEAFLKQDSLLHEEVFAISQEDGVL